MQIYEYIQHPHTTLHLTGRAPRPPKVDDGRVGLNGKAMQIQQHLAAQDVVLHQLIAGAKTGIGYGIGGAAGTGGAAGAAGA